MIPKHLNLGPGLWFPSEHEPNCCLGQHVGPCATTSHEVFVLNSDGKVLWRQPLRQDPYSEDLSSPYWTQYIPALNAAQATCAQEAARLGGTAHTRWHAKFVEKI